MSTTPLAAPSVDASITVDTIREHLLARIEPHQLAWARRRLQIKAVIVVAAFVLSYALLYVGTIHWVAIPFGVLGLMAVGYASISAVMHDANHSAMFKSERASRVVGHWLDLFGASSMMWCFKHNAVHHDFANVSDTDTDVQQGPFLRLTPHQQWRPWFRFQHIYAPVLYGFVTLYTFAADFVNLVRHRVKNQRMDFQPNVGQLAIFGMGKVAFVLWAVVIPVWFYGLWALPVALLASWVVGLALSLTVQLAHAVDIVEFHESKDDMAGQNFVFFQAQVTADVATRGVSGSIIRWFVGGLDKQLAHHLAPSLPHTLYPQLQPHIEALCEEHGVTYRSHPSVRAALRSHFRFLRDLAQKPQVAFH